MKKLILVILTTFLTCTLFAQREKSNYEKYREAKELEELGQSKTVKNIEYDDLYFNPDKDSIVLKQKKQKKEKKVVVNNYRNIEPFYYTRIINRYHRGHFNLMFGFYEAPYYSLYYYDSWYYYDWSFSPSYYRNHYPYYGWYYNRLHYRNYNKWLFNQNQYNYYSNVIMQPKNNNIRRTAPTTGSNIVQRNAVEVSKPTGIVTRAVERREYNPEYTTPRTSSRPQYNNTRTEQRTSTRIQVNNESRYGNNQPSRSTATSTQTRTYDTQSRTVAPLTAPSRAPSNAPSRSYSEPTQSRSSSTGTMNSGSSGVSRSTGSSSNSSSSSRTTSTGRR